MSSPACAACGQPVVEASGSQAPSPAPFLFFRGRRWVFCGPPCRLAFKRDAVSLSERHPDRGLAPYPDAAPMPPRPTRQSPFANLLKAGSAQTVANPDAAPQGAGAAGAHDGAEPSGRGET